MTCPSEFCRNNIDLLEPEEIANIANCTLLATVRYQAIRGGYTDATLTATPGPYQTSDSWKRYIAKILNEAQNCMNPIFTAQEIKIIVAQKQQSGELI